MRMARTSNFGLALSLDAILFPDSFRELPEAGNKYWLAWNEEGEPVGYASARRLREESREPRWRETAFLSRVGVLASARKGGLQRRFIRARVRWARRHGLKRVVTYTAWGNVWSARALVREQFLPYSPDYHWAGDVLYLERELKEKCDAT